MNMSPASVHLRAKAEFSLSYEVLSVVFRSSRGLDMIESLIRRTKPYPGWIPLHPCFLATSIILSPSRYAVGPPILTADGELNACSDCASGSVYMVVVRTPYSDAVLPTRLQFLSKPILKDGKEGS